VYVLVIKIFSARTLCIFQAFILLSTHKALCKLIILDRVSKRPPVSWRSFLRPPPGRERPLELLRDELGKIEDEGPTEAEILRAQGAYWNSRG
jgi:hypothetical protein